MSEEITSQDRHTVGTASKPTFLAAEANANADARCSSLTSRYIDGQIAAVKTAYEVPSRSMAGIGESVGTVKTGNRNMMYLRHGHIICIQRRIPCGAKAICINNNLKPKDKRNGNTNSQDKREFLVLVVPIGVLSKVRACVRACVRCCEAKGSEDTAEGSKADLINDPDNERHQDRRETERNRHDNVGSRGRVYPAC